MTEPVRIVITLEGGLVLAVCTLGVPVEAIVLDYDTEGANDLTAIPQGGGGMVDACLSHWTAEPLDPEVMAGLESHWEA